jgi:hypothetical protein
MEGRHGVGFVDRVGIECLCGQEFSFGSGGWISFNEHVTLSWQHQVFSMVDLQWAMLQLASPYAPPPASVPPQEFARWVDDDERLEQWLEDNQPSVLELIGPFRAPTLRFP